MKMTKDANDIDVLKYPIGEFECPKKISKEMLNKALKVLMRFPFELKELINGLLDAQLEQRYRPGGWNIRQLVHHCADSHINAYVRCKLALTEENPVITPYQEDIWAELNDYRSNSLANSISILEGLHARWSELLSGLKEHELKKTYFHPEEARKIELKEVILHYSWHCRHHLEHIRLAIQRDS